MARALPFVPFSLTLDSEDRPAKPPRPGAEALRRRAEAIKDRVYQRHVADALDPAYGLTWKHLTREQKLALVAQVAEKRAREELGRRIPQSALDLAQAKEPIAEYVQRSGVMNAERWEALNEAERRQTFFAAAVRNFFKRVSDEVLRELRAERSGTARASASVN
jgi:hypothetical protein